MSREQRHTVIILKKQPLNETDELVTFLSREHGKMRALAKSVKLSKSKLAPALQPPFEVVLRLAGQNLPKIIGAEVRQSFLGLQNNLEAASVVFYVLELLLKFLPDGQSQPKIFDLSREFFFELSKAGPEDSIFSGLAKFEIDFLDNLGFSVANEVPETSEKAYFSNSLGGFSLGNGGVPVSSDVVKAFANFTGPTSSLPKSMQAPVSGARELHELLSGFLEYQLERRLKSKNFLNQSSVL